MFKFPLHVSDIVNLELTSAEQRLFSNQLAILSRVDPTNAQYYLGVRSSIEPTEPSASLVENLECVDAGISVIDDMAAPLDQADAQMPEWAKDLQLQGITVKVVDGTVFVLEEEQRLRA